ncbi:P-loop containing nucleoside triphosphate hydrolase protein [Glonium stellatum]|uniref:P-loop containing nucleoside triphosphate hydrolase protein n=1 Tax=Glonium stellatum TaxID=574774 RepID=A0A8E2FDF0_9PEZI|nr:P-loop containing nucleoside triphosphate hydrolase protein [Glonium stellatum]
MNEYISERFSTRHTTQPYEPSTVPFTSSYQQSRSNTEIRQYFETARRPLTGGTWLTRPEIPTSAEILDIPDEGQGTTSEGSDTPLQVNKTLGPYSSEEEYLSSQYNLLREDSIRPLREAVGHIRADPFNLPESGYGSGVGIYEKVYINAVTFSPRGLAVRVTFSLRRVGKRVRWDQSKRLVTGSLVALTPETDNFRTKCILATVAARPLAALDQDPPEIDLFFARPEELEIDPFISWTMVEERTGFYEASRHTMLALQRLMREPFPLSEHIVQVQQDVKAAQYVMNRPHKDLSSIVAIEDASSFENINILKDWPDTSTTGLDKSQSTALKRVLTKRLAIIQGPPGTGKTHVSVVALKALVSNMTTDDPPVIITCQTNHALDQLLRHVAQFEPNFIRLGGRSKDQDVIRKRTLFEVRQATSNLPASGGLRGPAMKRLKEITKTMRLLLSPLEANKGPLDHVLLHKLGILTLAQANSLETGAASMLGDQKDSPGIHMELWMGKSLIPVQRTVCPEDFGFEFEEVDLEFEQLKELEAEAFAKDDDDIEALKGPVTLLSDNYTGKLTELMDDFKIRQLLEEQDLYKIHYRMRGPIYRYLQRRAKEVILIEFRQQARKYELYALQRRVGMWEQDSVLLKRQKVIGMTTTGLSKYRALVASLNPKVILVEEAAETLEAPIAAACVPSLEHLILVGDHKQLRPHCQVKAHEGEPFNFNMSLFERMVNNKVEFDSLKRQRRMIPEIRRILKPIYGDLISDHPTVKDLTNRPPVEGMGGCNSFFFTHQWPETQDSNMSSCNHQEAEMIVGFFDYLVYNGIKTDDITVLTFYNGQRKAILRGLRQHPNLKSHSFFKVVTVDSYQGEENDIVLLSLVRSNDKFKIGFLNVDNRVCVALSRAKRGLYIFGNGQLLCQESLTWVGVVETFYDKRGSTPKTGPAKRLGFHLPLQCKKHGRKTFIEEPGDWSMINGGCEIKCRSNLPCGHICMLRCHPFPHSAVNCTQRCQTTLDCGHLCSAVCCDPHRCTVCDKNNTRVRAVVKTTTKQQTKLLRQTISPFPSVSEAADWHKFAAGGVQAQDAADRQLVATQELVALQEAAMRTQDRLDGESSQNLFGVHASPSVIPTRVSAVKVNSNLLIDFSDDPPPEPRWRWEETFIPPKPKPKPILEDSLLD